MSTLNSPRRVPSGVSTGACEVRETVGRKALLPSNLGPPATAQRPGPGYPARYPYPGPVNLPAARVGSRRGTPSPPVTPVYGCPATPTRRVRGQR
jgi:hypothetical protein